MESKVDPNKLLKNPVGLFHVFSCVEDLNETYGVYQRIYVICETSRSGYVSPSWIV